MNEQQHQFTFIVSVTGPIARREEQVSSVVNVILQRQAHLTRPLLIRTATAGHEAFGALEASTSATASARLSAALAKVLPKHQVHRDRRRRSRVSLYSQSIQLATRGVTL